MECALFREATLFLRAALNIWEVKNLWEREGRRAGMDKVLFICSGSMSCDVAVPIGSVKS